MKLRSIALGFVIGALLTAGLGFGVVQASASGAATYYACLSKGKLTNVGSAPATCKFPAVAISWGASGTNGANVLTSSGNPYGSCVSGNTDIALSTDEVWSCSSNGTWTDTGSSIKGSQGIQGVQGVQGVQGLQGAQGPPGPGPTTYTWSGNLLTAPAGTMTFPAGDTITVTSATLNGTLTGCEPLFPDGPPGFFSVQLATGGSGVDLIWTVFISTDPTTLSNVGADSTSTTSGVLTAASNLAFQPPGCQVGTPGGDVTFSMTFTVTPPPTPYS